MPNRRPPTKSTMVSVPADGDFRQRYDAVEARRERLIARLHALGGNARKPIPATGAR